MKLLRYIWLLCLLAGCDKELEIDNLNGGRVYIIGHAGSGRESIDNPYPPNSQTSVTNAIELYNADGVEVDIQLSADGVLFMYHDSTLGISSNCTGCISGYTADVLSSCTFKTNTGQKDEYISALEPLIQKFATRSIKPIVFMDLHSDVGCVQQVPGEYQAYSNEITDAIVQLVERYDAAGWIYLQSTNIDWLQTTRQKHPEMRAFLDGNITMEDIEKAEAYGFDGIAANMHSLTAEIVDEAHRHGLEVQVYGPIISSDIESAATMGADYLMTDNIPLAQNILR